MMVEITITEEAVRESLAQFIQPPAIKYAPPMGPVIVGSLCLDNPLSRAITALLPGRSVVSLCDNMIRVEWKGATRRTEVPLSYRYFDTLFCDLVYASRNRSKKQKAKAAELEARLMELLPLKVEVR